MISIKANIRCIGSFTAESADAPRAPGGTQCEPTRYRSAATRLILSSQTTETHQRGPRQ
jgi:hypothetical protein